MVLYWLQDKLWDHYVSQDDEKIIEKKITCLGSHSFVQVSNKQLFFAQYPSWPGILIGPRDTGVRRKVCLYLDGVSISVKEVETKQVK